MTCRELTEFLSDYVADELPDGVGREFEIHVKLCRDCKVFLTQFRETVEAGRSIADDFQDVAVPEDLVHAIMKAVSTQKDP